jgi:hypothetical protein
MRICDDCKSLCYKVHVDVNGSEKRVCVAVITAEVMQRKVRNGESRTVG